MSRFVTAFWFNNGCKHSHTLTHRVRAYTSYNGHAFLSDNSAGLLKHFLAECIQCAQCTGSQGACWCIFLYVWVCLYTHSAAPAKWRWGPLRLEGGGGCLWLSLRHRKVWLTEVSAQSRFSFFFCTGGAVNNGPGRFDWVAHAHVNQPRRFSDEGDISSCKTDERSLWLAHRQVWPFIQLVVRGDTNSHSCTVIFSLFSKGSVGITYLLFCLPFLPIRYAKTVSQTETAKKKRVGLIFVSFSMTLELFLSI